MTSYKAILILFALSAWGQDYKLTSTEATRLEKTLETDPEDVTARERLLVYYAGRPDDASRLSRFRHIEWLIEHHPDSPLLYRDSASFKPADFKPPYEGDLRVIVAAWQQQAEEHKSDVRVLGNAVKVLYQVNYALTADCLKQLRGIEPTNPRWVVQFASLYGGAVTSPELRAKALADLDASKDLPVIGMAGQGFYGMGKKAHLEPLSQLGEALLKRAQSLDPLNPRWSTSAAEKPGLLTERDMWPYGAVPAIAVPEDAVRLAPESEAARLVHKVAPECIPGPNAACPQKATTLKLGAIIGKNGRVRYLHATSGDMSTIPAAMDAARQWTYQPAMIDGQVVEVVTEIAVVVNPPKVAAPSSGAPVSKGSDFTPPVAVTKAEAEYTPEAHAVKLEGSVQVSLTVDEHGLPRDVKVVHGLGMGLDEKAVEAVRKWTFRPGIKDGKPIAVPATVEVQFKVR